MRVLITVNTLFLYYMHKDTGAIQFVFAPIVFSSLSIFFFCVQVSMPITR